MKEDDSNIKKSDDYVWEPNRKVVSELPSAEQKMDDNRKELIRRGLEFDIIDVRSYVGYRGDLLVEFTTLDLNAMQSLKKTAEDMEMEVVVRQNPLMIYQVYCITPTDDILELKED
jgi:hypothetical protein